MYKNLKKKKKRYKTVLPVKLSIYNNVCPNYMPIQNFKVFSVETRQLASHFNNATYAAQGSTTINLLVNKDKCRYCKHKII